MWNALQYEFIIRKPAFLAGFTELEFFHHLIIFPPPALIFLDYWWRDAFKDARKWLNLENEYLSDWTFKIESFCIRFAVFSYTE